MIEIITYCIQQTATIREALKRINETSGSGQMLFVLNDKQQVVATLSDGDIRRGLIAGHELNEPVEQIMFSNFRFLQLGNIQIEQLRQFREQQLPIVPILDTDGRLYDIINLRKQKSLLPIDAIIMAGGKGERLRPLTEKTPKPLLPVGDKAIIDHNVERLIQYGVEHISVTTNYLAEQIESHYAQPRNEVQIQCVREPRFLGTMGAVLLVKEFHNDVVLVMNSDLFTDIDFEDMYLHFINHGAEMSIAAVPYTVSIPFGICDLDGRNVKGIVEKPTYNYYANAGIYMLRREVINMIPENEFYNATDLIDALVKNGSKVIRYPLKGTWIDIGSVSEYNKAKDLLRHM